MSQSNNAPGFPKSMRDIMIGLEEDEISLTQRADDGGPDIVITISVHQAEAVSQWLQEAVLTLKKESKGR